MDARIVTDLTKLDGDPTGRAEVRITETIELEAKMPGWLGGSTFKLTGRAFAGSSQNTATTTLLLVAMSCLLAGAAVTLGVAPMTALIVGLCAPISIFAFVRVIPARESK